MKVLTLSVALACLLPAAARAQSSSPTPTPPPSQGPAPEATASPTPSGSSSASGPREGWYRPGSAPRDREDERSTPRRYRGWMADYDDEREGDPNQDSVFYMPTGRTLRRGELSLGFPGAGGIPDIQYGLTNFLQIGAGYTLTGFTPQA
ncbi:MAG TPA: hypothetical protein VMV18_08420, partial [bacterium]|nr:hypothetical protein [bacterium]